MRGKTAALFVGVIAGVLAAVAAGDSTVTAGTGTAQIRVVDRLVATERVDVGKRGKSAGDMEVVRARLFDRRARTRQLGRYELICTYVDSGRNRICRGTYFLPRGSLVVGGSLRFYQFYNLAVVGGTGLFDNARGTLTITRSGRNPVRNVVLFKLVG